MATVTQSIGTDTRDHSSITLWEADLDDDPTYDSGDVAVGETYDDSDFDEAVNINGGSTIGLTDIRLSVASGERHDGTAGTGARFVQSSVKILSMGFGSGSGPNAIIEWLELDGGGFNCNVRTETAQGSTLTLQQMIFHNMKGAIPAAGFIRLQSKFLTANNFLNSIVYDLDHSSGGAISYAAITALATDSTRPKQLFNITCHDISNSSGGGDTACFHLDDITGSNMQNCIGTDPSSSGTAVCYDDETFLNATISHNLASDTTASGTGSLDSKSAANQYVSTTGGSEDLHLKSGADAINAGTDLGTTPSGVEIDINGRDRDAEGDTWDMGAHELVAAAAGRIMSSLANTGGLAGYGGIAGPGGGLAG